MYEMDIGVLSTGPSWYQRERLLRCIVVCCTLQPDTEDNLITRRGDRAVSARVCGMYVRVLPGTIEAVWPVMLHYLRL